MDLKLLIWFLAMCMYVVVSQPITLKETDPPGTVLMELLGHEGNCSVTSATPAIDYDKYVTISANNSLQIRKYLDLEVLYTQLQDDEDPNGLSLSLNVSCDDAILEVTLFIEAVNEFPPTFIGAPFNASIPENVAEGHSVFQLEAPRNVNDLDSVRYGNIVSYNLHPFQIIQFDGRPFFAINSSTGVITNTLRLDYEELARKYYILNISATDDGGLSTTTSLNIYVIDIDDNPPQFLQKRCHGNGLCPIDEYSVSMDKDFQGVLLTDVGPVYAIDGDRGIDAAIIYTFAEEVKDNMTSNIAIDTNSGQLTVLTPYWEIADFTTDDVFELEFTIIATEETINRFSSNVSLTVSVYRQLPTSSAITSLETTSKSPSKNISSATEKHNEDNNELTYLVLKITIPCVAFIIIVVVVVLLVVRRNRQKAREAIYNVKEGERRRREAALTDNRISTLSSTPINPYELMSVYARMPLRSNDVTTQSQSLVGENVTTLIGSTGGTDVNGVRSYDVVGASKEGRPENDVTDLYAKVDKPKSKTATSGDADGDYQEIAPEVENGPDDKQTSESREISPTQVENMLNAEFILGGGDDNAVATDEAGTLY